MAFKIDPSVLNSASLRLAVIGNNISNSGVTGFKGSDFSDVLASTSGSTSANGVRVAGSRQLFTQGTVQSSGNGLDMAINGKGFYRLFRPSDGTYGYTRDGSFNLDKDGRITNPTGDILTGYDVDASNKVSVGTLKQLQIDTRNSAPKATEFATMNLLLDSRYAPTIDGQIAVPPATAPAIGSKTFTPDDASTYTSTTISTVYDQQGSSHTLQSYFVKRAPGEWDIYTTMDDIPNNIGTPSFGNGVYPTPGTPLATTQVIFPSASLKFGQDGKLTDYFTYSGNTPQSQFDPDKPISLKIDYRDSSYVIGDPLNPNPENASFKLDLTKTQQYASDFLSSTQQDGFPTGQFQSVSVDKDGTLYANYSSGQSSIVGQVVLATFPSETNLVQDRNNQFVETPASGSPSINQPGKGGAGQVLGSSIETAGVDLTSEMIKLISAQRTYQANSEVVKRQDQIMQTVIGIGQ
jgi:flagellar hook protein FlgE